MMSLWVPDLLDSYGLDERVGALRLAVAEFTDIRPGIQVKIVAKKDQGDGGLYHLLSTAYDVAPTILPDLIVLNQADLQVAISEGFVQPITPVYLDYADFYAFALEDLKRDGGLYGIPLLTMATHFVYRVGVSASPPLTWTTVLTEGYSLLFPGGPTSGVADDALLTLYLGSGGIIQDEEGRATLERANLEELYRFFTALAESGVLDTRQALGLIDSAACYALYQAGTGTLSPVPGTLYWHETSTGSSPSWAPTVAGNPVSLGRTWTIAMVAREGSRQDYALELALWLASPGVQVELSQATGMFPSRRSAVQNLDYSQEEKQFLDHLLRGTTKIAPPQVDLAVRRALQAGLTVLLTEPATTPEEAAAYALTTLRQ